jgi:hypothetical protein
MNISQISIAFLVIFVKDSRDLIQGASKLDYLLIISIFQRCPTQQLRQQFEDLSETTEIKVTTRTGSLTSNNSEKFMSFNYIDPLDTYRNDEDFIVKIAVSG